MRRLGWDKAELARQAGISPHTSGKAVDGEAVSRRVARNIAGALSKALGTTINVGDVQGLHVEGPPSKGEKPKV